MFQFFNFVEVITSLLDFIWHEFTYYLLILSWNSSLIVRNLKLKILQLYLIIKIFVFTSRIESFFFWGGGVDIYYSVSHLLIFLLSKQT